jgi:hypothetical protein
MSADLEDDEDDSWDEDEDEDSEDEDSEDDADDDEDSVEATGEDAAAVGASFVLANGSRRAETRVVLEGTTLRMEAAESFPSAEAASKAYERLRRVLAAEGYREG